MLLAFALTGALLTLAALGATVAPSQGSANLAAFAGVCVVGMLCFVGLALRWAASQTKALDGGFAAAGIAPTSIMLNLRAYQGRCKGRAVSAFFARRGPLLELSVESGVAGALRVSTRTATTALLGDALNDPQVPTQDAALAGFEVRSADPRWAAMILSEPAMRDAVLRAMHDPSGRELREFALRPGALRWTRRYFPATAVAAEVPAMIDLLARAAHCAERLAPPAVPVPLGAMEHMARANPAGLSARVALVAVIGTLVLAAVGTVVALALMSSVAS